MQIAFVSHLADINKLPVGSLETMSAKVTNRRYDMIMMI